MLRSRLFKKKETSELLCVLALEAINFKFGGLLIFFESLLD